ncbi:N-terminal methyltransferase [Nomia melanderi]|uniref:N-terminal methyltransferase n=1 Tax=Nomia melanderi TaxID=2448451 RepID=UPI001304791A|nr:N-terminal Xaa-Pro-Lys N-methyltransferase 1 [Nomia melanderi]XP_031837977.1 N-terminal Xaa-Pro-Lys N-methyltransferase 1 [Nomia melanderi]XP_031837978.1 N-terminal Xaa-Pro-Lys N-methyltransferase 1 [Nomia melanderi]XP_031837979.1 N-terminal Xaa-Pro-Lys N-methyltransferase 1 [Nomia melanderi]XP_031837980.1 N-terminal Xaa-Pro-Lys N-methyltransferase 1 [Nomia melanderi]XP_031837981.1 N-terminal Xaa-Pro-Lys N-methyltransferase 1 [Nomia melanderi]XP_031837982.1 N-terminal Xaa-Pro-Lys N-methylt
MEREENGNVENEFYTAAAKYWEHIPPTIDGMLGGFGFISQTDIKGSTTFLKALFESKYAPSKTYAIDCGAGIGRITKNLLLNHFKCVDLVEQNSKFLEAAKTCLKNYSARIGNYYPIGLQNFCFTAKKYDVIWCQWVLGHLKEDHLVEFFKNCSIGLRPNGVIIVKENVTSSKHLEVDEKDSSVTRPLSQLYHIFQKANLICVKEEQQHKFPRGLYPVYMFALKPVNTL